MSIDFSSFLGRTRFNFGVEAPYINARSIEKYYFEIYGHRNQNAIFANWLNGNRDAVIVAFDHLSNARDLNTGRLNITTPEQKISHLVRKPPNSTTIIHPLVATIFAFSISNEFRVVMVSNIAGMMNSKIANRYINLADVYSKSNLRWQSIVNDKDLEIQRLTRRIEMCRACIGNLERQIDSNAKNNMSFFQRISKCLKLRSTLRRVNTNSDYTIFRDDAAEI